MKFVKFIAAVAAIASVSFGAFAQTSQGASMDTGKGGFRITVEFDKPLDGPFDFAHNKGPKVNTINGNTYGEMGFAANRSETAVSNYNVAVFRDDNANKRSKPYTAEALAEDALEKEGFKGKGERFECPQVPVEGGGIVCYTASGIRVFDKPMANWRGSVAIIAVSFKNNTTGYVLIGSSTEKDPSKYDLDKTQLQKYSKSALAKLWKGHRVDLQ